MASHKLSITHATAYPGKIWGTTMGAPQASPTNPVGSIYGRLRITPRDASLPYARVPIRYSPPGEYSLLCYQYEPFVDK